MNRLNRAILMSLPFSSDGTAAKTYRDELRALSSQGLAVRADGKWLRTEAGEDFAQDEPIVRAEPSGSLMSRVPLRVLAKLDERAGASERSRSALVCELLLDWLEHGAPAPRKAEPRRAEARAEGPGLRRVG